MPVDILLRQSNDGFIGRRPACGGRPTIVCVVRNYGPQHRASYVDAGLCFYSQVHPEQRFSQLFEFFLGQWLGMNRGLQKPAAKTILQPAQIKSCRYIHRSWCA